MPRPKRSDAVPYCCAKVGEKISVKLVQGIVLAAGLYCAPEAKPLLVSRLIVSYAYGYVISARAVDQRILHRRRLAFMSYVQKASMSLVRVTFC